MFFPTLVVSVGLRDKGGHRGGAGLVAVPLRRLDIAMVDLMGKTMGKPWENHGKTTEKP